VVPKIDEKLGYFIFAISAAVKEDIYKELSIIVCMLRRIILEDIWFEQIGH
jgi:hypothetical protein